jgi:putative FmdB family regulatory protein
VPTYGYRCKNCSLEFEVRQRMTDKSIAACPNCGGEGRRLIFPAGIVFKGSGFYKTDSRKTGGSSDTPAPVKTAATKTEPSSSPASDGAAKKAKPAPSSSSSESSG